MDNLSLDSPVVVDVGSHTMKAGLSVNFPSDREPSVVRERGEEKMFFFTSPARSFRRRP